MALLDAVRSPVYRGALAVMDGCGLRIGEVVQVAVKDVDKAQMVIRVVGKGNKERLTPLPHRLYLDLRQMWRTQPRTEWLFANLRGTDHLDAGVLTKVFAQVRDALGLDATIKPHSLRHSFATRLFEQGVPAETVRILLGHASVRTTQTYLHLTEPIRTQITETVSAFYVPLFS